MNSAGGTQAALGMVPADQRLEAGDAALGDRDDRLVVDLELAALDGAPQVGLQPEELDRARVHAAVEDLVRALRRAALARYIAMSASRSTSSGRS